MLVCQPGYAMLLRCCCILWCICACPSVNAAVRENTRYMVSGDTIPDIEDSLRYEMEQRIKTVAGLPDGGLQLKPDVTGLQRQGKQQLNGLKSLKPKNPLNKLQAVEAPKVPGLKGLLSRGKVTITNEGQVERSYFDNSYYYMNNLQLNGSITLSKIPFALQFLHQDLFRYGYYNTNKFNIHFDREAYLDNYRKQLKKQLTVDDLVPKDALLEQTKAAAEKAIRSEMDSMKKDYEAVAGKSLSALDSVKDYTKPDVQSTFQSLLNAKYAREIKEKELALQQLQEKIQRGDTTINKEQLGKYKKEIDAYYKLLATYKRYQQLSQKLKLPALNKQAAQDALKRAKKFEEMLNDPESLKKLALEKLPLNGMEKMFMNIQRLSAGQQTISLSSLSLYNYMHSGASMEIYNNNRYLFLLIGKQQDLNSVYDRSYFTNMSSNDHIASGIRLGRGPLDGNHTHMSLFTFKQKRSFADGNLLRTPARSSMVLGLSNRFDLDESSAISVELSKSSSVYDKASYDLDTSGRKTALNQLLNGEDFFKTFALTLKYNGSFKELGLDVNADIAYIASGYYNPGSAFLPRGTKQSNIGVKKSFLKKKIVLNLRSNFREYTFGSTTDSKWRTTSFLIDTRFKLSNGQQLSVKYQPSRGKQITPGSKLLNNATDRFSVDANFQRIWGKIFYRNMVSTAFSNTRYLMFSNGMISSKTVTTSTMQNVTLGTNLLYWNNTYTYAHNPAGLVYLNSSYNTDAGITYQLNDRVTMTSGLNYTSATGWYKQLGTRQAVTAMLNKKLDVSVFVDARKNIDQSSSYYDDLFRIDWSLKYHF